MADRGLDYIHWQYRHANPDRIEKYLNVKDEILKNSLIEQMDARESAAFGGGERGAFLFSQINKEILMGNIEKDVLTELNNNQSSMYSGSSGLIFLCSDENKIASIANKVANELNGDFSYQKLSRDTVMMDKIIKDADLFEAFVNGLQQIIDTLNTAMKSGSLLSAAFVDIYKTGWDSGKNVDSILDSIKRKIKKQIGDDQHLRAVNSTGLGTLNAVVTQLSVLQQKTGLEPEDLQQTQALIKKIGGLLSTIGRGASGENIIGEGLRKAVLKNLGTLFPKVSGSNVGSKYVKYSSDIQKLMSEAYGQDKKSVVNTSDFNLSVSGNGIEGSLGFNIKNYTIDPNTNLGIFKINQGNTIGTIFATTILNNMKNTQYAIMNTIAAVHYSNDGSLSEKMAISNYNNAKRILGLANLVNSLSGTGKKGDSATYFVANGKIFRIKDIIEKVFNSNKDAYITLSIINKKGENEPKNNRSAEMRSKDVKAMIYAQNTKTELHLLL